MQLSVVSCQSLPLQPKARYVLTAWFADCRNTTTGGFYGRTRCRYYYGQFIG